MDIIGVGNSGQASFEAYKSTVDVKPVEDKATSEKLNDETNDSKQYVSEEIKKSVEKLNSILKLKNEQALISRHEVFGDIMIKVVNKDTKEVVLEIPPEKILDMIAKMCEITGLKLDKKA